MDTPFTVSGHEPGSAKHVKFGLFSKSLSCKHCAVSNNKRGNSYSLTFCMILRTTLPPPPRHYLMLGASSNAHQSCKHKSNLCRRLKKHYSMDAYGSRIRTWSDTCAGLLKFAILTSWFSGGSATVAFWNLDQLNLWWPTLAVTFIVNILRTKVFLQKFNWE
jgi:hypothetical protein